MASNFIPLQEAAERLGIPTDRLVEMRSQGEIRGFRDGASWKFPEAEIERVKGELADVLDEAPSGGSSLLVSEEELGGGTGSSKSKVIGGDSERSEEGSGAGSDLGLADETSSAEGSDVNLVASQGDDQDVALVPSGADAPAAASSLEEADDSELTLQDDDEGELKLADDAVANANQSGSGSKIESDLSLEADPMEGSDHNLELLDEDLSSADDDAGSDKDDVLSEIDLTSSESGGTGDLIHGDSDPALEGAGSGSGVQVDDALSDDDDLVISDDDDDDLVLGGAGSDISVAGDSGINLMSPSDSGLSLESEPLDLAGSSISALDLGSELDDGSSASSGSGSGSGSGIGSGSLVDFQADEEFQLSPSGVDIDEDEDSGSQVIEVEDSQAFGSDVNLGEGDLEGDVFGEAEAVEDDALVGDEALEADDAMGIDDVGVDTGAAPATGPAARPTYEVPFTVFNVITLACVLLIMCLGGMLMTDLMRNMWTYSETSAPVSSLTDALVDMAGLSP